jgi:hypothetical protein
LGVVLWQMVTGEKPYDTKTLSTFQLQSKIVQEYLPKTNTKWDLIISKATSKNINERYHSCDYILNLITSINNIELEEEFLEKTVVNTEGLIDKSTKNQKMLIGSIFSLIVFFGVYFTINTFDKDSDSDNTQVKKEQIEDITNEIVPIYNDNETDENIVQKEHTTQCSTTATKKNIKNEEKSNKKVDTEKFKVKYLSLCDKYKELCEEKKTARTVEEIKIIISDMKKTNIELSKIWDDWNNTGLRKIEDKECECY